MGRFSGGFQRWVKRATSPSRLTLVIRKARFGGGLEPARAKRTVLVVDGVPINPAERGKRWICIPVLQGWGWSTSVACAEGCSGHGDDHCDVSYAQAYTRVCTGVRCVVSLRQKREVWRSLCCCSRVLRDFPSCHVDIDSRHFNIDSRRFDVDSSTASFRRLLNPMQGRHNARPDKLIRACLSE